ncbi:MAG: precorrin-3B C(17)-methyltransferase [Bacteroidales bacterium]|nr:precorrin-3B C(17)-methyltransferase [Bacteroidales bacterium]MBQ4196287.1 precorrin-3B C(17)-methyltransferase [Bacteroidales bacterium]
MGKIIVAGIGPGSGQDITPAVMKAVSEADAVVGYKYYFRFIEQYLKEGAVCLDTGMKQEKDRARQAMELARQGKTVCVISSGDSGIYGMAPLLYQMRSEIKEEVEIETLPGISAFQKAASLLGAPIGHDLCIISLSDLMTPWLLIEKRIRAAAQADFITAVYNPKSHGRYWQLYRLVEIFLEEGRSPQTPVGCVRQAGREDQKVWTTTLSALNPEDVDMFTVLIIGNSQTYLEGSAMITPRGYYSGNLSKQAPKELNSGNATSNECICRSERKIGQDIMHESFRTISSELKRKEYPLGHKWALLHAIHTTADFEMEHLLYTDENAVERLYQKVADGTLKTIVTDVTMAATGIRKGALARLGIEAKTYLMDPRVAQIAEKEGVTRSQAGIRLAVEEHPDALFAFGNAPTALMELCSLIRQGKAHPAGIVAAPVGFVHVQESKHMLLPFKDIPKIIVKGRKGGSNLAATLCNAILTFDDAKNLDPGRDL